MLYPISGQNITPPPRLQAQQMPPADSVAVFDRPWGEKRSRDLRAIVKSG